MSGVAGFCQWLEQTRMGASVRESLWLFPIIETVHLLGMIVLVGTIVSFDLRLLGFAFRGAGVSDLGRRILRWAWFGFAVQLVTGTLLFASEASKMVINPAFRIKMLLIVLGGLNAAVFHWLSCRPASEWDRAGRLPIAARAAGLLSILIWTGVVAAGRFIGFV